MDKKCDKYESLFTFQNEETLNQHIAECEDCRLEHEKMLKVSELIQEVKPYYQQDKFRYLRVACVMFAMVIGGVSLGIADHNYGVVDTLKYGEQLTLEDLGLPTDSYGFIMVDE